MSIRIKTSIKTSIKIITVLLLLVVGETSFAQDKVSSKFGKGIKFMAKDSSFTMKFSTRMQNRYVGSIQPVGDEMNYGDQIFLRRARIKFDGYVHSPKVVYKLEYDVVNGNVLDAAVKWNIAKNTWLWVGQTKLPGNRERVISSQKLQFVDRSLLNSKYTLDRDKGVQLRHSFSVGEVVIREIGSVSLGEGLNYKDVSTGHGYTARIEVLPMGEFAGKGDYSMSDLRREKKPKLALGFTYDYNDNAVMSRGQKGDLFNTSKDLILYEADMMFKFNGLSIMSEFTQRTAGDGEPVVLDQDGLLIAEYYTGSGFNACIGYIFKNNIEIASRYTTLNPERTTGNAEIKEYTVGLSKYVVGHSLKVQGDVSLRQEESKDDKYILRLQVEVAF